MKTWNVFLTAVLFVLLMGCSGKLPSAVVQPPSADEMTIHLTAEIISTDVGESNYEDWSNGTFYVGPFAKVVVEENAFSYHMKVFETDHNGNDVREIGDFDFEAYSEDPVFDVDGYKCLVIKKDTGELYSQRCFYFDFIYPPTATPGPHSAVTPSPRMVISTSLS